MINEYLFLSDEHRALVEAYKPETVTVKLSDVENRTLWIAAYSLPNRNEDSARKLSEVHKTIMQYSPLVLSCGSSGYYNRILFPLVNELERKLRKLLYLATSISDNGKANSSIKQLEKKDFGQIFDLLFTDQNFIQNMKKRINAETKSEFAGRSSYSKGEIKSYLDSLVEHTLWDTILSEKDVPALRSRFRDVQTYRNDVMHAHNIDRRRFSKARYLFKTINKELDNAIDRQIGISEKRPDVRRLETNTAISLALAAMDLSTISDAFMNVSFSPALLGISSQVLKELQNVQALCAGTALADAAKIMQAPIIQPALGEALKSLQLLTKRLSVVEPLAFQVSSVVEGFRRQTIELSEIMRAHQRGVSCLRSFLTLSESLSPTIKWFPHNLNKDNEPNAAEKMEPETDDNGENPEEDKPDE